MSISSEIDFIRSLKWRERITLGGACVAAASADLYALHLPSKEALIGGSILTAAGVVSMAVDYRKKLITEESFPPDDPEGEPYQEPEAQLIQFPSAGTSHQELRRAA